LALLARSAQTPSQLTAPTHASAHVALSQASPPLQTLPTSPQLLESVARFTQLSVGPALPKVGAGTRLPAQLAAQAPFVQISPSAQACPQPPQLLADVFVFTHRRLQTLCSVGHVAAQFPPTHTSPAPHAVPHVPQ